jgi:O-antigen/teichoic acid export membrane protein
VLQEEIGEFYLALSIINILFIFTDLGIDYTIARYVPYLLARKEFGKLDVLVKLSYYGGGMLTSIFAVACFFCADFISVLINVPSVAPPLKILSGYLVISELFTISLGILRGKKYIKEMNCINVLQAIAKLAITVVFIMYISSDANGLAWAFVLSFLLILPIVLYLSLKEIGKWPKYNSAISNKEKLKFAYEVVQFGFTTSLVVALWAVIQQTDKILLGYFNVPIVDIGIYSIVSGFAVLVTIFPGSINSIFLPIISELHGENKKEEIVRTTGMVLNWAVILAIPMIITLIVFSDKLLGMFYGESYLAGSSVLILLATGYFINSVFALCGNVISAIRRVDIQAKTVIVAAASNLVLNIILIPQFGIIGAAISSLVSLIVLAVLTVYYSAKLFGFFIPKNVYKTILVGVLTYGIIFTVRNIALPQLIEYELMFGETDVFIGKIFKLGVFGLLFAISLLVYFSLLYLTKAFGKDEILLFNKFMKRIGFARDM